MAAPAFHPAARNRFSLPVFIAWYSRFVRIGRSFMLITSNCGGIDSVVVPVRTDEPDEHHAPVVVHGGNQAIVSALDVERAGEVVFGTEGLNYIE